MKESELTKMLNETFDETNYESQEFHVFLLVNSNSGDRHGKELIKKFSPSTSINHHKNTTKFYVFDLFIKEQVSSCFLRIVELCQANINVSIIASGGDGTVQWVLSESITHRVDFSKVIFSTIPFGTGNDFAASIGWEKYNVEISEKGLKGLAIKLRECQIKKYDVWNCKIEVYPHGKITQIKNGLQTELSTTILEKSFTNYCGIGSDARISYFAQRMNASSVFMKKIIYGIAGIWSFFTCGTKLEKIIHYFYHCGSKSKNCHLENELSEKLLSTEQSIPKERTNISILSTDECLTFLNSTSSMEIENIWETPYSTNTKSVYEKQKVDDGLIEIISYRNELSIALERRIHMACKISQGEGPFTLLFNQGEKSECTYVHINGEPYKINSLRSLVVERNFDIQDAQIQVFKCEK